MKKNSILNKPLVSSIKHPYGALFIKSLMKTKSTEVYAITFEDFLKFLEKESNNILLKSWRPAHFLEIMTLIGRMLQSAGEDEGARRVRALAEGKRYEPPMYTTVVVAKIDKPKTTWNFHHVASGFFLFTKKLLGHSA